LDGTQLIIGHRGRIIDPHFSLIFHHILPNDLLVCLLKRLPLKEISPNENVCLTSRGNRKRKRFLEYAKLSDLAFVGCECEQSLPFILRNVMSEFPRESKKEENCPTVLVNSRRISESPLPVCCPREKCTAQNKSRIESSISCMNSASENSEIKRSWHWMYIQFSRESRYDFIIKLIFRRNRSFNTFVSREKLWFPSCLVDLRDSREKNALTKSVWGKMTDFFLCESTIYDSDWLYGNDVEANFRPEQAQKSGSLQIGFFSLTKFSSGRYLTLLKWKSKWRWFTFAWVTWRIRFEM
jgi:hypothetical protein